MPTARSSCAARRWEMSEMPSRRTCSPASGSPPAADPALSRARARAWPRIVARTRLGTETVGSRAMNAPLSCHTVVSKWAMATAESLSQLSLTSVSTPLSQ